MCCCMCWGSEEGGCDVVAVCGVGVGVGLEVMVCGCGCGWCVCDCVGLCGTAWDCVRPCATVCDRVRVCGWCVSDCVAVGCGCAMCAVHWWTGRWRALDHDGLSVDVDLDGDSW